MTRAQSAYAETFHRIRRHLCDEVPNGRTRKGEKLSERIDLDRHAHYITGVVIKAKGLA